MKVRGQSFKRFIKRWIIVGTSGFIAVGLLWWGHPYVLARLALFLVVDERLTHPADVIIVTSGSLVRISYAVFLYRQGFGRAILININPQDYDFHDTLPAINVYALLRRRLIEGGIPERDLVYAPRSSSTYEDALNSRDQVVRHSWRSAIVVSHPLHMRRVAWSFRNVFADLPVTLKFKALPLKVHFNNWWTVEQELVGVNNEIIKLLFYWFKYS